jgi:hypothetical protein
MKKKLEALTRGKNHEGTENTYIEGPEVLATLNTKKGEKALLRTRWQKKARRIGKNLRRIINIAKILDMKKRIEGSGHEVVPLQICICSPVGVEKVALKCSYSIIIAEEKKYPCSSLDMVGREKGIKRRKILRRKNYSSSKY